MSNGVTAHSKNVLNLARYVQHVLLYAFIDVMLCVSGHQIDSYLESWVFHRRASSRVSACGLLLPRHER